MNALFIASTSGRSINYELLFVFIFSPVLAIIFLRLGWRAWKEIHKSQQ